MEENNIGNVERKEELNEKKARINVWMISTIVIALLLVVSLFTRGFGIGSITGATTEDVEEKVKGYIKENLVDPGSDVEFGEFEEENGLYKFSIKIRGMEFDSYASKDGRLLFPSVIDMDKEVPKLDQGGQQQEAEDWSVFENKLPVNIKSEILGFEDDKPSTYEGKILVYDGYKLIPKSLIVFYSAGCGWCKKYYPVLLETEKKYPDVKIYALDLRGNSDIADKYGITGTPANVINGKYKVSGYMDVEALSEILDKLN